MLEHPICVPAGLVKEDVAFLSAPLSKQRSYLSQSPRVDSRSVADIMKQRVYNAEDSCDDAFFVADLGSVVRQYKQWVSLLPRVLPFFAMKCNPDPLIIQTLHEKGAGFDCASMAEIQLALDAGCLPENIIFANPCKQISHIRFAASKGVTVMTFDNLDELYKVKKVMPNAKMVLRILTDDSKSLCRFGIKFGAAMSVVPQLLKAAKEIKLDVIGISFHVGSGCFDASAFKDAVILARQAFDIGESLGFKFSLLDIGGGFPGKQKTGLQFTEIATTIRPVIDALFPPHIRVIAEPGRYFVSHAFTLAANIIARRVVVTQNCQVSQTQIQTQTRSPTKEMNPAFMYYINDGMYGSFNCITFDHAKVVAKPLLLSGQFMPKDKESGSQSSIWGPTCDSIDCIGKDLELPEMTVGDWLYFPNMGAYTIAAASAFNGFKQSKVFYTYAKEE